MSDLFWSVMDRLIDNVDIGYIPDPVIIGHPSIVPAGMVEANGYPVYRLATVPPDTMYLATREHADEMRAQDREWLLHLGIDVDAE